jgi:hypothetical protein
MPKPVLCLDSQSPSTEAHQVKHYAAKDGRSIEFERCKAVSQHDVFVLITTADSIYVPFGEQVPDRCVLVCGKNWDKSVHDLC